MNSMLTISPADLKARINQGETLIIIDVREDDEVAAGMIPGAKHIPLGQLPERHNEIEQTGEVILVCRSGARSGKACAYLQQIGFGGVTNMTGGMLEWNNE